MSGEHWHITAYGPDAWLVRCLPSDNPSSTTKAPVSPSAIACTQQAFWGPFLVEAVPGPVNCLLLFQSGHRPPAQNISKQLAALDHTTSKAATTHHRLLVRYVGPDLQAVADALGRAPGEVISLHASAEYRVMCLGFAPGFAYLSGLPAPLALPRRSSPRPRIPRGNVAIGGGHAGIYSVPTAGGWHLLGSTDQPLFFPEASVVEQHFLLQPGDSVTFQPA